MNFSELSPPPESTAESAIPYRAVSGMAIVAFVLGCLSPLALAHLVLWLIPAVAIVVAWLALRGIQNSDVGGEWLARIGMGLAILFAVWTVSRAVFSDYAHQLKARQFADSWLQLVETGELRHAHQWSISAGSRVRDASLVDAYYEGNEEGQGILRRFLAKGGMPKLAPFPSGATLRFVQWDEWTSAGNQWLGKLRYELRTADGRAEPIVISVSRDIESETRKVRWQVVAIESPS